MRYRTLGNSGLIVSEIALGTMQFGRKMNVGNLDQAETNKQIDFALDRGVNFIDTADVYSLGESEEFIGNAIHDKRQELVLATKVRLPMSENFNRGGATRVNILRGAESSLKRLRTDYIDLYQLHSWDSNTPFEETARAMDDLVRQGKVRYIGFSNYLSWHGSTALAVQRELGLNKFITAQMYYSLVGRGLEFEFQSMAEYYKLGILVWSPLAGGFLSGKYERGKKAPSGTRFKDSGNFIPFDHEKGYHILDAVKAVAARHGVSAARVSLAWLLAQPAISSVLIGGRTHEQIADNIAASELKLSEQDLKELDDASNPGTPYPKWMVLQQDVAEDPRSKVLYPERYQNGSPWEDRRGHGWE